MKGCTHRRQLSKIAALCVFFLDNFGIAVVYPIFTPLLLETGYGLVNDSTSLAMRTLMLGILIASFPLAQVFGAPLLGRLADISGRRIAFFLTLIGGAIGYLLSGLGIEVGSYVLLLASRFLTGLFASNLTLALASISDLTHTPKERSRNFGILATVAGFSFIVAIFIGGAFSSRLLDRDFSSAIPFWIASAISLLNLYIIVRFYDETSHHKGTTPLTIKKFFHTLLPPIKEKGIYVLYGAYFFYMLGWIPSLQFLSYFMIERFGVEKETIVLLFLCVGVAWMLGTSLMNPLLHKGISPKGLAVISSFFTAFFLFLPVAEIPFHSFFTFYILAALFSSLAWTNITSWISVQAGREIQGKTLGINQSVGSCAIILGPILGALLTRLTDSFLIGSIAASIFISFLLLFTFMVIKK
ncbi:MAG: MFS transporter [Candidatus Algichlamydia australiensis]|nr:MFS transporter [Chlamydiales bacterium]